MKRLISAAILGLSVSIAGLPADAASAQLQAQAARKVSQLGLDPSPIQYMENVDLVELNSVLNEKRTTRQTKRSRAKFLMEEAAEKAGQ